jgi:uncharacterized protein DUF5335
MAGKKPQDKKKQQTKKFTPITKSAAKKKESGKPGGGAGRVEDVRGSGVYPASGPLPEGDAPYRGQMSFGQGERGEAGYYDSGDSEITPLGAEGAGGMNETLRRQEIPRDQWVSFFDGFSQQHQGWLASIEVTTKGSGSLIEANDLPLDSIVTNLKHGDQDTISIILAKGQDEYLTHNISNTKRVWLEKTSAGADAGLQLESADGSKTRLRFRTPATPETLDGVMSAEGPKGPRNERR